MRQTRDHRRRASHRETETRGQKNERFPAVGQPETDGAPISGFGGQESRSRILRHEWRQRHGFPAYLIKCGLPSHDLGSVADNPGCVSGNVGRAVAPASANPVPELPMISGPAADDLGPLQLNSETHFGHPHKTWKSQVFNSVDRLSIAIPNGFDLALLVLYGNAG